MGERAGAAGRKRQGGDPWVAAVGARDGVPEKRRPARAPRDPYVLPAGSCGPRAVAGRWRGRAEADTVAAPTAAATTPTKTLRPPLLPPRPPPPPPTHTSCVPGGTHHQRAARQALRGACCVPQRATVGKRGRGGNSAEPLPLPRPQPFNPSTINASTQ